jgi:hypothetical protein
MRRVLIPVAVAATLCSAPTGCDDDQTGPDTGHRRFMMGFSAIPPRPDTTIVLPTLTLAAQHSDAGLIQLSIPWTVLLADTAAATEVRIVRLPLVNYYRATGRRVVVALDVTDGLNRAVEAPELVAAGRSITDSAVQRRYREYVAAVDSILRPDYLSLAAETNLIRLAAPAPVYSAVVTMVNAAASELSTAGSATPLLVSVQVEVAWGRLAGTGGAAFVGVGQDRADFPFMDALGLSSYPFLGGFADPDSLPLDYYSRLTSTAPLPVIVLEGGWTSVPAGGAMGSPEMQARYIGRQALLLDHADAVGLFQITFTDLQLSALSLPPGSILPLFAYLGLVDTLLAPKPALAAWDTVLARPLRP